MWWYRCELSDTHNTHAHTIVFARNTPSAAGRLLAAA
jgi:hypothetical protein